MDDRPGWVVSCIDFMANHYLLVWAVVAAAYSHAIYDGLRLDRAIRGRVS